MSRNHDKCIFFTPFYNIKAHILEAFHERSDATAVKALDGAEVGGKGLAGNRFLFRMAGYGLGIQ